MPNYKAHFPCSNCNRPVLIGSHLCRVCGKNFEPDTPKPCALCLEFKELKCSHAIPNSSFKRIFQGRQAIVVTGDIDVPPKPSNESFKTHQLCLDCEGLLSKNYEAYPLPRLRGERGKRVIHSNCITFDEINIGKFQSFFLSIFWRAANSEHLEYASAFIPEPWNCEIREQLLNKQPVSLKLATVKISFLKERRITQRISSFASYYEAIL